MQHQHVCLIRTACCDSEATSPVPSSRPARAMQAGQGTMKAYYIGGQMRPSLAALPPVSSGLSTLLGERETLRQDTSVHNQTSKDG